MIYTQTEGTDMELRLITISKTEYEVLEMESTAHGMHYSIRKNSNENAQVKDLFRDEKNDMWTLWSHQNGRSGTGLPKQITEPTFRTVNLDEV
jgi:hypothetical protein